MKDHPLLRGSLETIILSLLEGGEMYGYEITSKVKQLSNDHIKITEGALYPALHKLEAKGALTTRMATVNNRKRKYYKITKEGNNTIAEKKEQFAQFVQSMSLILNPKLT